MNELHLFGGAGGGILAGMSLGHRPVCAVEWEPYAQAVLVARQNDGTFPLFPIWDNVQSFDGKPWRGVVDVVAGGFPCQDISVAGSGAGIDGERSGLWREMARIIGEVRPSYVFVENSPALITRGLGTVLCDLAALGFDARWTVLGASDVGAHHHRERIWILAHANCMRKLQPQGRKRDQRGRPSNCSHEAHVSDSDSDSVQGLEPESQSRRLRRPIGLHGGARSLPAWPDDPSEATEPRVDRVADGVAHRSHRIKALGNGQVPRVAATAWRMLDVWGS